MLIYPSVCFQVASVVNNTFLSLTYSESPRFATVDGDATNNQNPTDLPLYFGLQNGTNCVGSDFIRGGFRFLSIRLPKDPKEDKGFWDTSSKESLTDTSKRDPNATVSLTELWVNCTAFPSNPNPRAYTGYFSSSSTVLNRVWYAGAYTLQLSTIVPTEGGASIDYNSIVDGNKSPVDSWHSNFTISNGTAVTTDGAKRDRMVWPGDGWSTGPTMVLLTGILGIKFTAPLGRSYIIRPHRTKWLSHIEGGYSTSLGQFVVKLNGMIGKGGRQAEVIQVSTPTGTSGTIQWGGN